jgi:hypothetical protein
MYSARIIVGMIYRIFLLSLIVAVLWGKGYLWWVLGIAIVLLLIHVVANLPIVRRTADDDSDEDADDSDAENNGEDIPPF